LVLSSACGEPVADTRSLISASLNGLGNWRTVVGALMTRQVKGRFQANQMGLLLAFAEPFLLLGMIMMLRVVFKQKLAVFGQSEMVFLSSGILPYYVFVRTSAGTRRSSRLEPSRRPPRAGNTDLFIATIAADMVVFLSMMVVWFSILVLVGLEEAIPHSIETCLAALFFIAAFGIGLGLISSAIASVIPIWSYIYGFAARMLIFLSGVFYVIDLLRLQSIREDMALNPLAHGIVWFRLGLYGSYPHTMLDTDYMMLWSVAVLLMGLIAHRGTLRPVTR
jgi:capsular polysaccharide transport system permease protein